MIRALQSAALIAALAGVGWFWFQADSAAARADRLQVQLTNAQADAAFWQASTLQVTDALTVARAEADRQRAIATEYESFRRAIIEGGQDADLPQWFVDVLSDLRGMRDRPAR